MNINDVSIHNGDLMVNGINYGSVTSPMTINIQFASFLDVLISYCESYDIVNVGDVVVDRNEIIFRAYACGYIEGAWDRMTLALSLDNLKDIQNIEDL